MLQSADFATVPDIAEQFPVIVPLVLRQTGKGGFHQQVFVAVADNGHRTIDQGADFIGGNLGITAGNHKPGGGIGP